MNFGCNWYDYGHRFYDPTLARFPSLDNLSEEFYHNTPYQYAMNSPIKHVDFMGDSAWDITSQWNEDFISQYQNAVQKMITKYQRDKKEFTCEDLALSVLIDFSQENGLPVTIVTESGTFDARSDDYTDGATFKNDVLTKTGAPDLQNDKNTTTIISAFAKSGDIILNRNDDDVATHVQVVYHPTNQIGVMGIRQGNSGGLNWVPGSSRILGASNPQSAFYTGTKIENAIYVPNLDYYKNYTKNSDIENYWTAKNIAFKRWNFSNF